MLQKTNNSLILLYYNAMQNKYPSLFHTATKRTLGVIAFLFILLFQSFSLHALEIENHEVLKTLLKEMRQLGSAPEVYPLSEKYRLDLSLVDLVDQATVIADKYDGLNDILKEAYADQNFPKWLEVLNLQADQNEKLKAELDKKLYMQFYSPAGIALLPDYKYIDFQKIKDNAKLVNIRKYNRFANDPEASGILSLFESREWKGFYTKPLSVSKVRELKFKHLKQLRRSYYNAVIKLYEAQDQFAVFTSNKHGLKALSNEKMNSKSLRLFNKLQELPNKHEIFLLLSQSIENIPYREGMFIVSPTFIHRNYNAIVEALKELTLNQIIHSHDDQYLLSVRKYLRDNIDQIESDLKKYNQENQTDLKILYVERAKKPRRLEAIANLDNLIILYPDSPWMKTDRGVLFDRQGKEIYVDKRAKHFFSKIFKNLVQTETYLSILAGSVTLVSTNGNIPIAIGTQKLVKELIKTKRYDKEWEDFLKEAPKDIIDALLLGSGVGVGRFYKIIALGAGQGFLQSLLTGQDLRTGAAVGAGLNLIQYYILPRNIGRPMTDGFDAKSLAINRRLELLEKTIKGTIQGSVVAALDGESIIGGAVKGSIYGLVSTQLLIWFIGTRYNPFKDYSDADVDEMIELENEYQNLVGRGGEYAIDRQLILDANYRVGGVLTDMISASITLPGNVSMSDQGFKRLTTMTHEAHHLMQQHQSGVFGFYLFRYIPTGLRTGYAGHPDENFLKTIL